MSKVSSLSVLTQDHRQEIRSKGRNFKGKGISKGFINKDTCGGVTHDVQIIFENVRIPENVLEKQSIITNRVL